MKISRIEVLRRLRPASVMSVIYFSCISKHREVSKGGRGERKEEEKQGWCWATVYVLGGDSQTAIELSP